METLNHVFITYALPELILFIGLCFFFIAMPKRPALKGYRMARRMMGCCYLLLFAASVTQLVGTHMTMPAVVTQMIRISDAIFQAFLFTTALITLIDVRYFTWPRFLLELFIILQPVVFAFGIYFLFLTSTPVWVQYIPFGLLVIFYAYKLFSYVSLFRRRYQDYELRMDNFFSDDESKRLRWVMWAFYMALFIGIFAMIYNIYPSTVMNLLFTLAVIIVYSIFGVRFISYAFIFHKIETPLVAADFEEPSTDANGSTAIRLDQESLMQQINAVMAEERLYTNPNLVIEDVAVKVGTSFRAVSIVINACCNTTFRGYVNIFRVKEAERMINEGYLVDHTTDALATAVGFANRVSFYRAFKKATGKSPTDIKTS